MKRLDGSAYYGYRPDSDERLKQLNSEWFQKKTVLDIGCNTGEVTIKIAREFKPDRVTGVDVNKDVIDIARRNLSDLQAITLVKRKSNDMCSLVPRSVAKKVTAKSRQNEFPHNIQFGLADVTEEVSQEIYDTVVCLSVSKWVHLNNGDSGILKMFKNVHRILRPGGLFVLEYQPWKSYIKNKNSSITTKSNFPFLKIRPENFESILENIGFEVISRLGTPLSEARGFNRPILVLSKRQSVTDEPNGQHCTLNDNSNSENEMSTIVVKKRKNETITARSTFQNEHREYKKAKKKMI